MKFLNKFDYLMYTCFAACLILFLLSKECSSFGIIPTQELAIDMLSIGGIFLGFSCNKSIKEGKRVQFNQLQRFGGFFVGGMGLLGGIFNMIMRFIS